MISVELLHFGDSGSVLNRLPTLQTLTRVRNLLVYKVLHLYCTHGRILISFRPDVVSSQNIVIRSGLASTYPAPIQYSFEFDCASMLYKTRRNLHQSSRVKFARGSNSSCSMRSMMINKTSFRAAKIIYEHRLSCILFVAQHINISIMY